MTLSRLNRNSDTCILSLIALFYNVLKTEMDDESADFVTIQLSEIQGYVFNTKRVERFKEAL